MLSAGVGAIRPPRLPRSRRGSPPPVPRSSAWRGPRVAVEAHVHQLFPRRHVAVPPGRGDAGDAQPGSLPFANEVSDGERGAAGDLTRKEGNVASPASPPCSERIRTRVALAAGVASEVRPE